MWICDCVYKSMSFVILFGMHIASNILNLFGPHLSWSIVWIYHMQVSFQMEFVKYRIVFMPFVDVWRISARIKLLTKMRSVVMKFIWSWKRFISTEIGFEFPWKCEWNEEQWIRRRWNKTKECELFVRIGCCRIT